MVTASPSSDSGRRLAGLFRVTTAFLLLTVMMGSLVCSTESGKACPTWPGCFRGTPIPDLQLSPWIEFSHRLVAMTCGALVIAAAVAARKHHDLRVRWLPVVSLVGAALSAIFGMMIILFHLPLLLGLLDLSAALVALISMMAATQALVNPASLWRVTPTARRVWTALAGLVVMHVLGLIVAGNGSFTRCISWPVLHSVPADRFGALQIARLTIAALVIALVASSLPYRALRGHVAALLAAMAVEIGLGLVIAHQSVRTPLFAVYSEIAVLILWGTALLAVRATCGPASVASLDEQPNLRTPQELPV